MRLSIGLICAALLARSAYSAELSCKLFVNGVEVDQKVHSIEKTKDDDHFEFDLVSGEYRAHLAWSFRDFSLELEDSTTNQFNLESGHWQPWSTGYAALPDNWSTSPVAKATCEMDVSDGADPIFKDYLGDVAYHSKLVKIDIQLVVDLAGANPTTPADEQELDRAICVAIGGVGNGSNLADYGRMINSLADYEPKRFPDLYSMYTSLQDQAWYLENFCALIYQGDPNPIPMGDRTTLKQRTLELPPLLDGIQSYLETH